MRLSLSLTLLIGSIFCYSQSATITGVVRDDQGVALEGANIVIEAMELFTVSNEYGEFNIVVPSNLDFEIKCSYSGHVTFAKEFRLKEGEKKRLKIFLRFTELAAIPVVSETSRDGPMERLEPKLTRFIPTPSAGIESLLISQLGVSSNNELSSSYSVRGGSFDENLVYVNDIEVYRPFLTRTGQQEGLSFANPNMVSDILFSAGGFDAKYGDKMSSVLDVKYTRPKGREGSFSGGLLGGALHYGNTNRNGRLGYVTGLRYKTNQYLLGSLDEEGDYNSQFLDLQTYLTYGLSDVWQMEFLGNVASNRYNFVPRTRVTQLGSINEALQLTVFFEGQEITEYDTYFGAFSFTNTAIKDVNLKFITSAFRTSEREDFDVLGQYRLDELERDLGSDEFGEVIANIGVGGYLNHARNKLEATVLNFSHKGIKTMPTQTLHWGAGIRSEQITDRLSEWSYIDSAGFSLPYSAGGPIDLDDLIKSQNAIDSYRLQAYVQDHFRNADKRWEATIGARANHWSFTGQTVVSPRARISWRPDWSKAIGDSIIKRNIVFKAAGGLYYQPPFYRELRGIDGQLNADIKAQQSIHVLLGADVIIQMFNRPFRLVTEGYYKRYNNLIPYELESVRLRYYATNNAKGHAYGLDTKINGEFIPGVESWASLSFMSAREDLTDDFYIEEKADGTEVRIEPGFIPRPTDQRVNFSMFFRDELPMNPSYKMNLSVHFGTGLPYGPPDFNRYRDTIRTPSYRRFDIGFSKQLIDDKTEFRNPNGFFSKFKEAWIALEVFNLLDIPNVQSQLWVKDVRGRLYSVPNYLTPRRLNLKIYFRF